MPNIYFKLFPLNLIYIQNLFVRLFLIYKNILFHLYSNNTYLYNDLAKFCTNNILD
jgi:hypothetical protein